MQKLALTNFDFEQLGQNIEKALMIVDTCGIKNKDADKIHNFLALKFKDKRPDFEWSDILLNISNIIPKNATKEEIDYLTEALVNIVQKVPNKKLPTVSTLELKSSEGRIDYEVVPVKNRFVLVKSGTDVVIDDAQGFGYTSEEAANKAGWYRFAGGRQKIQTATFWWKKNKYAYKSAYKFINKNNLVSYSEVGSLDNLKLIEHLEKVCRKKNLEGFDSSFIRSLHLVED